MDGRKGRGRGRWRWVAALVGVVAVIAGAVTYLVVGAFAWDAQSKVAARCDGRVFADATTGDFTAVSETGRIIDTRALRLIAKQIGVMRPDHAGAGTRRRYYVIEVFEFGEHLARQHQRRVTVA